MATFRVVDLGSQAEAVARHVRGWSAGECLAWIEQVGEVVRVRDDPAGVARYVFIAPSGLAVAFRFPHNGGLELQYRIGTSSLYVIDVPLRPTSFRDILPGGAARE